MNLKLILLLCCLSTLLTQRILAQITHTNKLLLHGYQQTEEFYKHQTSDKLFFATRHRDSFRIQSYAGDFHRQYPLFYVDSSANMTSAVEIDSSIYVSGYFPNFRHTGNDMKILKLYNFIWWDTINSFPGEQPHELNKVNDTMVGLQFSHNSGANFEYLCKLWMPSQLKRIRLFKDPTNLIGLNNNKENIILTWDSIFLYTNSQVSFIGKILTNNSLQYAVHNDTALYIYDSDGFKVFKIGRDHKLRLIKQLTGPSDYKGIAIKDNYLFIGDSKIMLLSDSSVNNSFGLTAVNSIISVKNTAYSIRELIGPPRFVKISKISTDPVLSGRMYNDLNADCKFNSGDKTYVNWQGMATNSTDTVLFYTEDSGKFEVSVPPGKYKFKINEKYINDKYKACNIHSDSNFIIGNLYTQLDLPFTMVPNKQDIRVKLNAYLGFRARLGFTEKYTVDYENLGSTIENFQMVLTKPDSFLLISSTPALDSQSGNQLFYNVRNLPARTSGKIKISFEVHSNIQFNAMKSFYLRSMPTNDLDSTNNYDTLHQKLVASLDPNLKSSAPEGTIYHPVSIIKYNIQFQNEGTDTAYRVTVIDSFIPNFPLWKLQMTGYSHPYQLIVKPGNILIWEFDNIKLSPKSENVNTSQGFFSFEAPLSYPLKKGQVISNKAYIYFDYQKPVLTPEVRVVYAEFPLAVKRAQPSVFTQYGPNPFDQNLLLRLSPNNEQGFEIYNLNGKLIFQANAVEKEITVKTGQWAAGLYILRPLNGEPAIKLIKN